MNHRTSFKVFGRSGWLDDLNRRIAAHARATGFGPKEAALLTLFYDDHLKADKPLVPKFAMYARVCESKPPEQWNLAMLEVNGSVLALLKLNFLVEKKYDSSVGAISERLAEGALLYALTATGYKELERLRPPIVLRLKAWISVLPPWLIAAGTIAGGVSALWKLIDALRDLGVLP